MAESESNGTSDAHLRTSGPPPATLTPIPSAPNSPPAFPFKTGGMMDPGEAAPPKRSQSRFFIFAAPPVFVFLWASGFVVARYATLYAPPLTFLSLRFACAAACFLIWILLSRPSWPKDTNTFFHLAITGVLTYGACLSCMWVAIRLGVGAGLSSLIASLQPVLTTVFMALTGHKILARQWVGMTVAAAGLVMVLYNKLSLGQADALNVTLAFFGLVFITAGGIYQKAFITKPVDVRTAQFIQQVASCMFTIPFACAETATIEWHYPDTGGPNWAVIGSLLWSCFAMSLVASCLLFMLISLGAVQVVTSMMFLVPPTTYVLAFLMYGESIPPLTIAGIVLTVLGVAFVVKPPLPACLEKRLDDCFPPKAESTLAEAGGSAPNSPAPATSPPPDMRKEKGQGNAAVPSATRLSSNATDDDGNDEETANPTAARGDESTPAVAAARAGEHDD